MTAGFVCHRALHSNRWPDSGDRGEACGRAYSPGWFSGRVTFV